MKKRLFTNGVVLVEVLTVVRYEWRANDNISCQSLYVTTIFWIIFLMFLLAASITPFIFGRYGEEFECLIFHLVHNSTIILPLKFYALSVTIFFGGPYRQIKSFFYKPLHYLLCYVGIWISFHPFCEVVKSHEDESMPIASFWVNMTDHINSPHCKWPGRY